MYKTIMEAGQEHRLLCMSVHGMQIFYKLSLTILSDCKNNSQYKSVKLQVSSKEQSLQKWKKSGLNGIHTCDLHDTKKMS